MEDSIIINTTTPQTAWLIYHYRSITPAMLLLLAITITTIVIPARLGQPKYLIDDRIYAVVLGVMKWDSEY